MSRVWHQQVSDVFRGLTHKHLAQPEQDRSYMVAVHCSSVPVKSYSPEFPSQPYVVQITSSSSENFVSFHEFFQFRKNRSHLEPGQCIWSQVSSSTGCHPKCRLWTTPSPTVFAIRVRIARQMAGGKTRNNNSFTTVSELWRNAGPSAFQLQVTMLKSDYS